MRHRGFGGGGGGAVALPGVLDYSKVKFVAWGDSLTASGSGYATVFGTSYTPSRPIYNGGVGGSTIAAQAALQQASSKDYLRDRVLLIHDKWNTGEDTSAYVATVQTMVEHQLSGKFLLIGGIRSTDGTQEPGSAGYIAQTTINSALAALYPDNFLDVFTLLYDDSTRSDHVHLTAAARDGILIPAIQQKLYDLGYMNVTS